MDQLANDFGQLSTAAREWTPLSMQSQEKGTTTMAGSPEWSLGDNGESGLNAKAVKEFVPGKGWSAASNATNTGSTSTSQEGT